MTLRVCVPAIQAIGPQKRAGSCEELQGWATPPCSEVASMGLRVRQLFGGVAQGGSSVARCVADVHDYVVDLTVVELALERLVWQLEQPFAVHCSCAFER